MASTPAVHLLFTLILITISTTCLASLIEDLNNLQPPPDFNATIASNCAQNPALRYCNNPSIDYLEIFRSTIVANYLCRESNNPHCPDTFKKIDLKNRHNFAPLYLSFTFFWKFCPLTILSIDLSNNSLNGGFPSDILHCSQIQYLDLSLNDFTGKIPLESFTQLTNLTCLNLSYNHFSESEITDSEFFKRFNSSSFLHSGLLPDLHKFHLKAVILLFGFPICVILIVGCLAFLCFYRPDYLPTIFQRKHKFTPAMVKAATNKFSKENLVGKVGNLEIYRGILRDGTEIRVEYYKEKISREDYKKFVEECKVLIQLHHKNLVKVLGWCDHRALKAVVTEWRYGETVEMWLLNCSPLWRQRLKVLRKVLEGMLYLQEQWPEVGFDVEASSLFLAEYGEPLITRFRVGDGNNNKNNICKFGVLLLEMIASKQPAGFKRGEVGLTEWVRMHYQENIWKVVDDRLKKTGMTQEQAERVIRLAFMCIDIPTEHHFSLAQVYNIITRFYEFSIDFRSPNKKIVHV